MNAKLHYYLLIGVFAIFILFLFWHVNAYHKCSDRGGTWLVREGVCLDVKELK